MCRVCTDTFDLLLSIMFYDNPCVVMTHTPEPVIKNMNCHAHKYSPRVQEITNERQQHKSVSIKNKKHILPSKKIKYIGLGECIAMLIGFCPT